MREIPERCPTSNVARDHVISELRTGQRDGQSTRGSNWSTLLRLIAYKVIKSVAILYPSAIIKWLASSLAIQY